MSKLSFTPYICQVTKSWEVTAARFYIKTGRQKPPLLTPIPAAVKQTVNIQKKNFLSVYNKNRGSGFQKTRIPCFNQILKRAPLCLPVHKDLFYPRAKIQAAFIGYPDNLFMGMFLFRNPCCHIGNAGDSQYLHTQIIGRYRLPVLWTYRSHPLPAPHRP